MSTEATSKPLIFVSYASEDFAAARRVVLALDALGEATVWFDKDRLKPGHTWKDEILEKLNASSFFIVVISSAWSRKSTFVKREWKYAIRKSRSSKEFWIIPIKIDRAGPIRRDVAAMQILDATADLDTALLKLCDSIRDRIRLDTDYAIGQFPHDKARELEQEWARQFGERLVKTEPRIVLQCVAAHHERFKGWGREKEFRVLRWLARICGIRNSQYVLDYTMACFEICRTLPDSGELWMRSADAVLATYEMTPKLRSVVLRHVFHTWVDYLSDYFEESWWFEIAIEHLIKHCVAAEGDTQVILARSGSGEARIGTPNAANALVRRALQMMRWDIPIVDLLLYAYTRGAPRENLYAAIDLVLCRPTSLDGLNLRTKLRSKYDWSKNTFSDIPFKERGFKFADRREEPHRIGFAIRAGYYLANTGYDEDAEDGFILIERGLQCADQLRSFDRMTDGGHVSYYGAACFLGHWFATREDTKLRALFAAVESASLMALDELVGTSLGYSVLSFLSPAPFQARNSTGQIIPIGIS